MADSASACPAPEGFGPAFILDVVQGHKHNHTAVMLHGRGSGAEEFAEELMESHTSDGQSLREALPGWRWVFPSSPELWSETFQEYMPAWFEARSLTDIAERQDLQVEGIEASVEYVKAVLREESERVGNRAERLVLGGISQGGAIGIWTLLSMRDALSNGPGAYVGASSWVPFGAEAESFLAEAERSLALEHTADVTRSQLGHDARRATKTETDPCGAFISKMLKATDKKPHPGIPVLLGHGVDDAYVDIALGRQAARLLSGVGHEVDWREYSGAEQEGHWFEVPHQMDHVCEFLRCFEERGRREPKVVMG